MASLNNDQKRKDRIYRLTKALVEMRPGRRQGDARAVKLIAGELEMLRTVEAMDRKGRA